MRAAGARPVPARPCCGCWPGADQLRGRRLSDGRPLASLCRRRSGRSRVRARRGGGRDDIDCDTCAVRGLGLRRLRGHRAARPPPARGDGGAAGGAERGGVELDGAEQAALAVLAGTGLVPPLRLLATPPGEAGIGGVGSGAVGSGAVGPGAGRSGGAGSLDVEGTDPGSGGERAPARTVSDQSPVPRRPGGRRAAG